MSSEGLADNAGFAALLAGEGFAELPDADEAGFAAPPGHKGADEAGFSTLLDADEAGCRVPLMVRKYLMVSDRTKA